MPVYVEFLRIYLTKPLSKNGPSFVLRIRLVTLTTIEFFVVVVVVGGGLLLLLLLLLFFNGEHLRLSPDQSFTSSERIGFSFAAGLTLFVWGFCY